MEELALGNLKWILSGLCMLAVAMYRLAKVEKRLEKTLDEAREDRKGIYKELHTNHTELVELRGQLKGGGYINGHSADR